MDVETQIPSKLRLGNRNILLDQSFRNSTVPKTTGRKIIPLFHSSTSSITSNSLENEESDTNHQSDHEEHSRLLLYVGLALAVAIVIGLIVFTISILRHRKYQQAKRELRKVLGGGRPPLDDFCPPPSDFFSELTFF